MEGPLPGKTSTLAARQNMQLRARGLVEVRRLASDRSTHPASVLASCTNLANPVSLFFLYRRHADDHVFFRSEPPDGGFFFDNCTSPFK